MSRRSSSENRHDPETFITEIKQGLSDIAAPAEQNLSKAKVRRELASKKKNSCLSRYRERFSNRRSKLGTGRALTLLFRDAAGDIKRNAPVIAKTAVPAVCIGAVVIAAGVKVNTEYPDISEADTVPAENTEAAVTAAPQTASVYYSTARLSAEPASKSNDIIEERFLSERLEEKLNARFPHIGEISEPSRVSAADTAPEEEAEPAVSHEDSPGYVVFADRVAVGVVGATDEIEAFLAEKKAPVLKLKNIEEDDVFFDKDITFEERVYVPPYILQDQQEVIDILSSRETEAEYYEVEAGDNLWAISSKLDMTVDELASRPAEFNGKPVELGNNIRIGTVIELETEAPFLSVEYRRLTDYEKDTPCETITVEDSSLMRGQEEVVEEGHDGITKVSAIVTYKVVTDEDGNTSGTPVRKRIVSEETLVSPSARIVHVGTSIPTVTRGTHAGSGDYFWPVDGGYISDTFGSNRNHKGLDIAAPAGTPIFAAADGTVYEVGSGWCGGYGNNVKILNDDGNVTVYAHMSMTNAENGQHVYAGDVIGYIGSTGDSTGNHLHFEVRNGGSYYDPEEFICQ